MKRGQLFITYAFIFSTFIGQAQIAVDNAAPYDDAAYLVDNILLGGGIVASNHSYQGDPIQLGYFDGANSNLGLDGGIVLCTGDIQELVPGIGFGGFPAGTATDPDLLTVANSVPGLIGQSFSVSSVNDVAVLEFDFIPTSDSLTFRYVFGSSEYFAYENSSYNDVFGFFISGPGITGPYSSPVGFPDGSINIATIPDSDPELPITISSVNANLNSQYFVDNSGVETVASADGFTTVLTATATVQCGETYHIRLSIADGSDGALSSYVFLEEASFVSPIIDVADNLGLDSTYMELECPESVVLTAADLGADFTYTWNTGDIGQSLLVNSTGNYFVEATNDANCSAVSTTYHVEIVQPDFLNLGTDITLCEGEQTDLSVNVSMTPPYTYNWNTGENTALITVGEGAYSLNLVDANGCFDDDQINVIYVDRPTAELLGGGTLCTGSPIGAPLNLMLTGSPPYTVTYTNGSLQFEEDGITLNNYIMTTFDQGTYQLLTVEDFNCEGTVNGSAEVITFELPTATLTGGEVICPGDSTRISIELTGQSPYFIVLNNGEYNFPLDSLDVEYLDTYVNTTGNYSFAYVVDGNNCMAEDLQGAANVLVKEYIDPSIVTTIDSVVCPIDDAFQLVSLNEGGKWYGAGIDINHNFHPMIAGPGEHWITYVMEDNCFEIDSLLISLDCNLEIFVPNTFTPNGDGWNDLLHIKANDNLLDYKIMIYNRWGEHLFTSNNISDLWNGSFNGEIVPTGIYSYVIQAFGKDGEILKKKGVFNLLQ